VLKILLKLQLFVNKLLIINNNIFSDLMLKATWSIFQKPAKKPEKQVILNNFAATFVSCIGKI